MMNFMIEGFKDLALLPVCGEQRGRKELFLLYGEAILN